LAVQLSQNLFICVLDSTDVKLFLKDWFRYKRTPAPGHFSPSRWFKTNTACSPHLCGIRTLPMSH